MVPQWYRLVMAMNLRLDEEDSELLRALADAEQVSLHGPFVSTWALTSSRPPRNDGSNAFCLVNGFVSYLENIPQVPSARASLRLAAPVALRRRLSYQTGW